jgi:TnpA family transposase
MDRSLFIEEQWDKILRFLATIRLKVTSASQLFKRLNSYSKQHPLYRGLKEFGTLFILKYVDDVEFRQAIEKQLNKVESSNKFSRAVSYGHNQDQEFIQSEKEDQEIAECCRRLIKNAIICWNYLRTRSTARSGPPRRVAQRRAQRLGRCVWAF